MLVVITMGVLGVHRRGMHRELFAAAQTSGSVWETFCIFASHGYAGSYTSYHVWLW